MFRKKEEPKGESERLNWTHLIGSLASALHLTLACAFHG
jgi:hypothetical protein